jgi:predicted carbohydrate-binding protein with CBM5 and CBM33 domain
MNVLSRRRPGRALATGLATAGLLGASVVLTAPAQAHGYISTPPSRQALCAAGTVKDCGAIQFEPQSVEAPKGSTLCSGGNSRFSVLDDESRNWPATPVGPAATFSWVLTARHATSTWQYFIGDTLLARFDDGGKQPGATVSHRVDFQGRTGRQKVLAVWNIADTPMAFYACIDLQIGKDGAGSGGNGPTTTPPTPAPTTKAPTTPAAPTTTAPTTAAPGTPGTGPADGQPWRAWTAYTRGDRVTFDGRLYECRQSHTTLPGWEPPVVLALWLPV